MSVEALARAPIQASENLLEDLLFGDNLVGQRPGIAEQPFLRPSKELVGRALDSTIANILELQSVQSLTPRVVELRPIVSRFRKLPDSLENTGRVIDASVLFEARKSINEFQTQYKDQFMMMAMAVRNAAMADMDGCGGVNERGGLKISGLSSLSGNNITSLSEFRTSKVFGNQTEHKTGEHGHCGSCGADLEKGKCNKCAA